MNGILVFLIVFLGIILSMVPIAGAIYPFVALTLTAVYGDLGDIPLLAALLGGVLFIGSAGAILIRFFAFGDEEPKEVFGVLLSPKKTRARLEASGGLYTGSVMAGAALLAVGLLLLLLIVPAVAFLASLLGLAALRLRGAERRRCLRLGRRRVCVGGSEGDE
jgi:hypothetical protein